MPTDKIKAVGKRAQVMHGTAHHTSGGLTKKDLKYNKHGKIVSRKKSAKGASLLKRLTSKGYFTRKGKFGYVKRSVGSKAKGTRKKKRTRKRGKYRWKRHPIKGVKWEDRRYKSGRFAKKPSYLR
jgi:hypothetical protein